MKNNKIYNQKSMSLTAFLAQCNGTDLSPDEKESTTRLLIKFLLLEKECHKYPNRPYELPKDFCCIAETCFELKEKSGETFHTIHRIFLNCSKDNWNKVSFFDISDALAILLSAQNNLPESLKAHLQEMHKLLSGLDYLSCRYPQLLEILFPEKSNINELKKKIFLSLCVSDKKTFLQNEDINTLKDKTSSLLENPYIIQKK